MTRKTIIISIAVFVGLLHFVTGPAYAGPWPIFVNGYLIDILLPFAMYLIFGLSLAHHRFSGLIRAGGLFVVGVTVETLQYFDIPLLGRTFDPLDFAAYAFGIGLAVLFENKVLSRIPEKPTR